MGQRYAQFQDAVQKLAVFGARYTNFDLQLLTESTNHGRRGAEAKKHEGYRIRTSNMWKISKQEPTYTYGI